MTRAERIETAARALVGYDDQHWIFCRPGEIAVDPETAIQALRNALDLPADVPVADWSKHGTRECPFFGRAVMDRPEAFVFGYCTIAGACAACNEAAYADA